MPNCFQLIRISDPKAGPLPLNKVDEEICEHFGEPVDAVKYYYHWYDVIGLRLACGQSFDEMLSLDPDKMLHDSHMRSIAEFMKERYVSTAWYQRGWD